MGVSARTQVSGTRLSRYRIAVHARFSLAFEHDLFLIVSFSESLW